MPSPFATATELSRGLRTRALSARDLVETAIERIERENDRLNAVVARDFERARRRAGEADAALDRGESRQPLLGVPMTIKDSLETEGLVTACGAPELAQHVPTRNADPVQRVLDAGAIVLGKTNVPLYAGDCQAFNDVYGTTNNPWDLTRTPGGSSGGAAAALAAGLTPIEIGSDIGGSIRNPAHLCGVFGHKPTWGILSDRGHIPGPPGTLAPTDLAVVGPLARSAEDLNLLLDVLAAPPPNDVRGGWRLELPAPRAQSPKGLRVAAWLDDPFSPVDDEYRTLLEASADALERAGAVVDRSARPAVDFGTSYWTYGQLLAPIIASGFPQEVLRGLEAAALEIAPDDRSQRALQVRGALVSHREWLMHDEIRHQMAAAWARFFRDFDVVLMPAMPTAAFPHDPHPDFHSRVLHVNGAARSYLDFLHWVSLATVAGLPATVAPIGRTRGGLPVGVQIVGGRFEDRTTIQTSAWLGEFTPPPGF